MGISLQRLTIPENLVPERGGYGNGRAIAYECGALSEVCEQIGVTRLDQFIVDHCALVEHAMVAAGWVGPRSYEEREVTGEDPKDADYFRLRTDDHGVPRRVAVYEYRAERIAAAKKAKQIEEEVERAKPWYDPADGLRTTRGLMDVIRRGIPTAWLEEGRQRQLRKLLEAGIERELAESCVPRPTGNGFDASLWDLRTFDLELRFAIRKNDRFHFWVSY